MANWYLSQQDYIKVQPWGGHVNKLLQSNTFSNASWTKVSVFDTTFATTTTGPDNVSGSAALLTESTTSSNHGIYQSISNSTTQTYCFSVYAKPGPNRTRLQLMMGNNSTGTNSYLATFDLTNGNYAANSASGSGVTFVNAGIEPAANGFYRIHMAVQIASTQTSLFCHLLIDTGAGQAAATFLYAGTNGNGVYIYGAQLNPGTLPHVYQATTTTAVNTVGSFTATIGDLVRPSANVGLSGTIGGERVFRCTTGGTAGATEPYWGITPVGTTTTDNTAVWTEVTGNETYQGTGSSPWLAPAARLFFLDPGTITRLATVSSVAAGGTGYAVNDIVRLNTGTALEHALVKVSTVSAGVITAVTVLSGGAYTAAPTTTAGATTAVTGSGSGATLTITTATTGTVPTAAGDTIFVAAGAHYEYTNIATTYAALGTGANPANILTATQNGNKPPVSADLVTTPSATIHALNSNSITFSLCGYARGLRLWAGSGSGAGTVGNGSGSTPGDQVLEFCEVGGWGTSIGGGTLTSGTTTVTEFRSTSFRLGSTADRRQLGTGTFRWLNSTAYVGSVQTSASALFFSGSGSLAWVENVDFSSITSATLNAALNSAVLTLKNCKLNSGITIVSPGGTAGGRVDLINCDSGATNYRNERYRYQGTLTTATTVVRTGGSSDGTTPFSHRIAAGTTNTNWRWPFEGFPIDIWNDTAGSSKTVTICGIAHMNGAGRLPNNDEFWWDLEYSGSSASPLGSFASGTKADVLDTASALTADTTSAWDSAATARANTTPYNLGDIVKVASNAGRLFACTTAGTSAGSEPGGFASATDTSGAITDGSASFTPMTRFKQSFTITPQMKGTIRAIPKCADQTASRVYYTDVLVTVT